MKIFIVSSIESKTNCGTIEQVFTLEVDAVTWAEQHGGVEDDGGRWWYCLGDMYYEISEENLNGMNSDFLAITQQSIVADSFLKQRASRDADVSDLVRILDITPDKATSMLPLPNIAMQAWCQAALETAIKYLNTQTAIDPQTQAYLNTKLAEAKAVVERIDT